MFGPGDLVAVSLPAVETARVIRNAWASGAAVAPLDPRSTGAASAEVLAALRPTVVVDADGPRRVEGTPVAIDVAAVVATSGTTGRPRLVELTASGLEASARAVHRALGPSDPDRPDHWLVCLPVHHVAGLAILARARTLGCGLTVHDRFDATAVAAASRSVGATLVSLVPTTLARLLDLTAPVHEFRRILVGGAPVPASLLDRARRAGARVAVTYGLTETGGGCVHDGAPLDGVELRLAADGEIQVRGPVVMRGYHGDPVATAAALDADGWLRTGDVGAFDTDGRLQVVDRLTDLVITGGVNVSPSAVEAVLGDHPAVAEVCVTGEPDPEWGERVVAHVVPADPTEPPTLTGLRAFAADRLAAAQLPRRIEVVATIPRSPSGKPLRRLLRGHAAPSG